MSSSQDCASTPTTPAKKKFTPYKGTTLDTPIFHFLVDPLLPVISPVLRGIYAVRWQLSRPLQMRVIPKVVPVVEIPVIQDLSYLTIGQVLLGLPLLIVFLGSYYFTFIAPHVQKTGDFAGYAMMATFLTANKTNSITSFLFGISFERMLPFHNLASLVTLVISCFHGYVAYAYSDGATEEQEDDENSIYAMTGSDPNFFKYLWDGGNNISGTLLVIATLVLISTSIYPTFRRLFFDVWLVVHILSAMCVVIFATMHEVSTILFVAAWWVVDMVFRYAVMAGCRYPRRARMELVTDDVVKLSFPKPKGFSYNCGQFVQISVPELGPLAFHPISISSAPHESDVTLHVRALGGWSQQLVEMAKSKQNVNILMEGPYGSLSVDIDDAHRYKMVLCVSGGIGVTHCGSVAKSIIHDHKLGRKLRHLRFVWAVRDLDMLNVLNVETLSQPEDVEMMNTTQNTFQGEFSSNCLSVTPSQQPIQNVQTDIFLTKADHAAPMRMGNNQHLYFGRPDVEAIIVDAKHKAQALGVSHVAVFACGPKALVDKLKDECRKQSDFQFDANGIGFDVHEEIFDF